MTTSMTSGSFFFGLSVPLAVGFVIFFLCPKYNVERIIGYTTASVVLLAAAFGAHWWYLFLHPPDKIISWILLDGGLKSYGAIVAGLLAAVFCLRLYKLPLDIGVSAALEVGVISLWCVRIGCTLNQEHLGPSTNLPFAVADQSGILRHNMGLYELIFLSVTLVPYVICTSKSEPNPKKTIFVITIGYGLYKATEKLLFQM